MNSSGSTQKNCFADLETVFPLGRDGLREVSPDCWPCPQRVECLRQAIAGKQAGRTLAEELEQRRPAEGLLGFARRWSRLKSRQEGTDS